MCKILILTSHNAAIRDSIIMKAWTHFSLTGETDGFGAAWLTYDGKLAYVKSRRPHYQQNIPSWVDSFGKDKLGSKRSNGGHLLIHGRKATCGVCLDNTHPMLSECETHALIHNGVVDSDTIKNVTSSCDSELLLNAMLQYGLPGLKEITGYFAFGMLTKGNLIIAKDNTANLYHAAMPTGHAFGTTPSTVGLVSDEPAVPVKDNIAITFGKNPRKPIAVDNIQKGMAKPSSQATLPWPDNEDDKPIYGDYYTNHKKSRWSRHHHAAALNDVITS